MIGWGQKKRSNDSQPADHSLVRDAMLAALGLDWLRLAARGFPVRSLSHTPSETMAVLAQTCKIALPARVAARSGKTARRTAIVAKAAAPVDAVRVQQKVRRDAKTPAIVSARNSARQSACRATRSGSSRASRDLDGRDRRGDARGS
jgi:hypothetical protein